MNQVETHYETLQVGRKAEQEVIDAAWKVLMRRYHPDGQTPDEEKARRVNHAHDVLSDSNKRRVYDAAIDQAASREQYTVFPGGFGGAFSGGLGGDGDAYAAAQEYMANPFAMPAIDQQEAINRLIQAALQLSGVAFQNFVKTLPPGIAPFVREYLKRQGRKVA